MAYVQTPTRQTRMSGAGGGRVTGSATVFSVNNGDVVPVPAGFPAPPTGLSTPLGNPNFPCAAGPEIQPTGPTTIPVDTGTGYYFRHLPNTEVAGNNNLLFTTE